LIFPEAKHLEKWRQNHRDERDQAWGLILKICEARSDWDELDDLQTLNDSAFDILEGVLSAYYSLEEVLAGYEAMASINAASYDAETEVIESLMDDLRERSRCLVDYYSKVLSALMSH
jgi:hypothetical protein